MRFLKCPLLITLLSTSGLGAEEMPEPNGPAKLRAEYKLVWRDEFDGPQLDSAKWKPVSPGQARKGGFNDESSAATDGQGHLQITIKKVGEEFHSGMISTQGKFETKYGYFECRARMQTQAGCWSAFWLQSAHIGDADQGAPNDPAKNGVECDVFEYLASRPDGFQHAMHWGGYGKYHQSKGFRVAAPQVRTGWHTYGVEWRPDGYSFYLDGRKTWDFKDAVSQTEQYLILSAEIGEWGGDIRKSKLPTDVAYDYVRVWQKPDVATAAPSKPR